MARRSALALRKYCEKFLDTICARDYKDLFSSAALTHGADFSHSTAYVANDPKRTFMSGLLFSTLPPLMRG